MYWDLRGNEGQNQLVQAALDHTDFPWHRLEKDSIPVEWEDLSRYATGDAEAHQHRGHGDSDEEFHPLEVRERVLGLAWYSGKVTLDLSLIHDPDLAMEVFLAEGAHMVDFFYMSDEERARVWNAFHPEHQDVSVDTVLQDGHEVNHGHSWFDVGGYYSWVGEAFMGGFIRAFSDLPVTIAFDHPPTPQAAAEIRHALLNGRLWYFGLEGSQVYHDWHIGIPRVLEWPSKEAAQLEGRRPCGVCKPERN